MEGSKSNAIVVPADNVILELRQVRKGGNSPVVVSQTLQTLFLLELRRKRLAQGSEEKAEDRWETGCRFVGKPLA